MNRTPRQRTRRRTIDAVVMPVVEALMAIFTLITLAIIVFGAMKAKDQPNATEITERT